jgi:hypothetical protein
VDAVGPADGHGVAAFATGDVTALGVALGASTGAVSPGSGP